jgi:hypothetical protein
MVSKLKRTWEDILLKRRLKGGGKGEGCEGLSSHGMLHQEIIY